MPTSPTLLHPDPPDLPPRSGDLSPSSLDDESLRNDGRIWVPKSGRPTRSAQHRGTNVTTYLERIIPPSATWCRSTRVPGAKNVCDARSRRGPRRSGVTRFRGRDQAARPCNTVEANTATSSTCTPRSPREPYETRCGSTPRCTHHGGLMCRYDLHHDPGLFVAGEANFSSRGYHPWRTGRRQFLDAWARRRLLRAAEHDQLLPLSAGRSPRSTIPSGGRPRLHSVPGANRQAAVDQRQPDGRLVPPRTGPPDL